MTQIHEEWRTAIEQTTQDARRYRWLRINPLPFFNELEAHELDAELDRQMGTLPKTGAEDLI